MSKSKTFRALKGLHKYLSLLILIYCLWMALSGIALNHPQLLQDFSLSNHIMPENYQYQNWNRMSWRDALFSQTEDNILYVGGKEGVWQSLDQGKSFAPLNSGFPTSAYVRDTLCLLLTNHEGQETLFAGTRSGLFFRGKSGWEKIKHPILGEKPVVDLLQVDGQILAFTNSRAFKAKTDENPPLFTGLSLPRQLENAPQTPLFRWLRKVHDGSIFGLPGRLFVDFIGLLLLFLSLSGLLIWHVTRRKKRRKKTILAGKIFSFNFRWHLRLGIIGALFIAITALSGAFAHPPLLLTIVRLTVPASLMPHNIADNPWAEQIQRAAYLKSRNRLIIATKQGLFSGPIDGSRDFIRLPDTLPIHGMGALVFESLDENRLLIGSFSGLYLWDTLNRIVMQLKARAQANTPDWGRPIMTTGVAVYKGEPLLAIDYESGVKPLRKRQQLLPVMPHAIRDKGRISLWHALFELHNGRIFEQYIGPFYWLITPAGGIIFCLIILSGSLLWIRRKLK
ncbi:MAG: PepSY domain-containing protein [Deltaproteobacteria bacterium]|nr:PepSY domain-containing protein [Deltaproteobacteria bacterium]